MWCLAQIIYLQLFVKAQFSTYYILWLSDRIAPIFCGLKEIVGIMRPQIE